MIKGTHRRIAALVAALGLGIGATVWAATAASAAPVAPAVIPKCSAGNVAVWVNLNTGGVALGTVRYHLDITNVSGHTCSLFGYPGVSATDGNGKQLGPAAVRVGGGSLKAVDIAPGGTIHAVFGYVDVAVTKSCKPVTSTLLKVFPPAATGFRLAFFVAPVCTTKTVDLTIQRVQPGI